MKNTLQDILDIDSYAKELSKGYEKKENEISINKNSQLRLLDQQLSNATDEERLHFAREIEEYEKENEKILDHYIEEGEHFKKNYQEKKEELLNFLTNKMMRSDGYDG